MTSSLASGAPAAVALFDAAAVPVALPPLDQHAAAAVTAWSTSTQAAAQSGRALATAAAQPGMSRAGLMRATAAVGAAIASAAVSHAALDVAPLRDTLPDAPAPDSAALRAGDAALLALLRGRSLGSVGDVVDLMTRIEALLVDGDGLKAFNTLYRLVTLQMNAPQPWEDSAWILGLDVIFADLYFDGLERCLAESAAAPAAWRALCDRRRQPGITPVQFALAGMSAHINRDLAVAVVRTWDRLGPPDHARDTASFRDYGRVNAVLDTVEPDAMAILASGVFELLDQILSPIDGWAAMSVVQVARDLAWTHAENLATLGLDTAGATAYVSTLDTLAADASRAAMLAAG